ncbi:MAG TPA: putative phosphothreonine lyase domain-containing protein [Streptosporangiaceae bacterium]|nr:putative phosphothreonine lyase domain-containing protein [Streptosporangiaceae bacterium]
MDQRPSQVTADYWIYADSPGTDADGMGRTGKWLVFVPAARIDSWWQKIKHATEAGDLGVSAKAATVRPNPLATSPKTKLICVYTRDWHDHDDVRRVLRELRVLGVSWRLSYKTDDATISGVYGTGSAVYVSQPDSQTFDDRTDRSSRSVRAPGPG